MVSYQLVAQIQSLQVFWLLKYILLALNHMSGSIILLVSGKLMDKPEQSYSDIV